MTESPEPIEIDQPAGAAETDGRRPPAGDRRAHPRLAADLMADCRQVGRRGEASDVQVLDLSQGGARLTGTIDLRTGDVLVVTLPTDGGALALTGLVVSAPEPRSRRTARAHVAWTSVSAADRDRLGTLLDRLAPAGA